MSRGRPSISATSTDRTDDDYFEDYGYCWRCDGHGFILVCCDDLCHGQGWCMHGDGNLVCPVCKGGYA